MKNTFIFGVFKLDPDDNQANDSRHTCVDIRKTICFLKGKVFGSVWLYANARYDEKQISLNLG